MAANSWRLGAYPVSGDARPHWRKMKNSVTLAEGDFVILTSGEVDIALAASTALFGVAAMKKTSAASGNEYVLVYDDPDMEFYVVADGDVSSLAPGAQPDIIGATGAMYLDADASSTDVLTFLGRANTDDDLTASGARCRVRITHGKHEAQ